MNLQTLSPAEYQALAVALAGSEGEQATSRFLAQLSSARRFRVWRRLMFDRAGWRFLLPAGVLGRVVVLASPFDGTVPALAVDGADVAVAGFDPVVLEYARRRAVQEAASDVADPKLALDTPRLSLPDASCDAFVMNDAQDQVFADGALATLSEASLEAVVSEAVRVLRPSGSAFFCLATGSAIPSLDWRGTMRAFTGRRTARRIRRALQRAGLAVRSYPMFFADGVLLEVVFGRYRSVKNTLSFKERLKEFLLRGRAAFWFTGGIGIVARKEPVTPTLLEQLALEVSRQEGPSAPSRAVRRYNILSGKVIVSLGSGEGRFGDRIVILPLTDATVTRRRREKTILEKLRNAGLQMSRLVPAPHAEGVLLGRPFFVLDEIPGISVDTHTSLLDTVTRGAANILTEFHRGTARVVECDERIFKEHVLKPLHSAAMRLDLASVVPGMEQSLRAHLGGCRLPTVWVHGDYKIENVLIDPASHGISGVIDWDYSQEGGLPLLDLLYLFAYNRTIRTGRSLEGAFIGALLADDYDPLERELLAAYAGALDLPRETLVTLGAMFWVYHFAYRIRVDPRLTEETRRSRTAFESVARYLESRTVAG